MIKDIAGSKTTFINWKESVEKNGIEELSKVNSNYIVKYILDMEEGRNVGTKKGNRSYIRLNISRQILVQMFVRLEERGVDDIIILDKRPEILFKYRNDLEKGVIKSKNDKKYSPSSMATQFRVFKAFWNWLKRVRKKEYRTLSEEERKKVNRENYILDDIAEDIPTQAPEPRFVYVTKEQLDNVVKKLSKEYQLFTKFLFDSLARPPKEALSLQGKNVYEKEGEVWIHIPDKDENGERFAKTQDRDFNLYMVGDALREYMKEKDIGEEDYLFQIDYRDFTSKLREATVNVLGKGISHPKAKKNFNEIIPYDLRHSGAIYLRIQASKTGLISLDVLRERGGWKDFEMINYYTKFIGLTGKISKEVLLVKDDKTNLEKDMEEHKKSTKNAVKLLLGVILHEGEDEPLNKKEREQAEAMLKQLEQS